MRETIGYCGTYSGETIRRVHGNLGFFAHAQTVDTEPASRSHALSISREEKAWLREARYSLEHSRQKITHEKMVYPYLVMIA